MKIVCVKLGKYIGDIYIGMSHKDEEKLRSIAPFSFRIEYKGNQVSFIEINAGTEIEFNCFYNNINLFKIKFILLVEILYALSSYDQEN